MGKNIKSKDSYIKVNIISKILNYKILKELASRLKEGFPSEAPIEPEEAIKHVFGIEKNAQGNLEHLLKNIPIETLQKGRNGILNIKTQTESTIIDVKKSFLTTLEKASATLDQIIEKRELDELEKEQAKLIKIKKVQAATSKPKLVEDVDKSQKIKDFISKSRPYLARYLNISAYENGDISISRNQKKATNTLKADLSELIIQIRNDGQFTEDDFKKVITELKETLNEAMYTGYSRPKGGNQINK